MPVKNMEYSQISSDSLLQQTVWCNKYVRYKGKTIFFQNWIKSGIKYVCDLFDENGRFKSIECFSQVLYRRHNILCEYIMLKSVFTKLGKHFNFSNAIHVNPKQKYVYVFHDGLKLIKGEKCKISYNSLLLKKTQMSPYQCIMAREFDIHDNIYWRKIYCNKIKYISDPIIAEFNYKLLHNILNNNYLVSKWKPGFDMKCRYCDTVIENTKHLIYECYNVRNIWSILSRLFGFKIQWKHVVVGFHLEDNSKIEVLNTTISFVACKIYKYKMYCRLESLEEREIDIHNHLKHNITFMGNVFKYSRNMI